MLIFLLVFKNSLFWFLTSTNFLHLMSSQFSSLDTFHSLINTKLVCCWRNIFGLLLLFCTGDSLGPDSSNFYVLHPTGMSFYFGSDTGKHEWPGSACYVDCVTYSGRVMKRLLVEFIYSLIFMHQASAWKYLPSYQIILFTANQGWVYGCNISLWS